VRFSLIHVEDDSDEVAVVIPGARVIMMVPLDGLPAFLPIVAKATEDAAEPCCEVCCEPLPGLPSHAEEEGEWRTTG
jgi:hypothetical protein